MRGADQHAKISINLADAYHGATRSLALREARLDESGNVVAAERVLDVRIPTGVKVGQSIRLRGQGSPGLNGGPAGDLYMEVEFEPDPRYRVEDRAVTHTVPVAPGFSVFTSTTRVTSTASARALVAAATSPSAVSSFALERL